jgi:hypothetical protein
MTALLLEVLHGAAGFPFEENLARFTSFNVEGGEAAIISLLQQSPLSVLSWRPCAVPRSVEPVRTG